MPSLQSRHLTALKSRLRAINVPEGGQLDWKLYTEFCSLHEAETSIVPFGIRDGYPKDVDFIALEERLIRGWIGEEIFAIANNPRSSDFFNGAAQEIDEMGKTRWSGLNHQSDERLTNNSMPG